MQYLYEEPGPKKQDYKVRAVPQILEIWYLVGFLYKLKMLLALEWPLWLIPVYLYDLSIFWHVSEDMLRLVFVLILVWTWHLHDSTYCNSSISFAKSVISAS